MRNRTGILLAAIACGLLACLGSTAQAGFAVLDPAGERQEQERLAAERAERAAALNNAIRLYYDAARVHSPGLTEPLIDHRRLQGPGATCTPGHAPRTHAILVGASDIGLKGLRLEGPANDLSLLSRLLGDLGVPEQNVHVLLDEAATRSGLRQTMLDVLDKVDCADRVFFHFSTHGVKATRLGGGAPSAGDANAFKAQWEALNREGYSYEDIRSAPAEEFDLPAELAYFFDKAFAREAEDMAFLLTDDREEFNEIVLGQDISDYMIAVRNKGAHAIASLDTVYAAAAGIEVRQKLADTRSAWSYAFGAKADETAGLSLVPGHGDYAVFYASGAEEMTPELKLPRGDPDARVFGLFSFHFANALAEGASATPRTISRVIESAYLGEDRYQGPSAPPSHPRIDASNPDLVLIAETASPQSSENPIRILSPAPRRGVFVLERQEIEIEGIVDWPVPTLGVHIDQQPVQIDDKGHFRGTVTLKNGMNRISVIAVTADARLHPYTLEFLYEGDRKALEGEGKRYAVIIANQTYSRATGFNSLSTPFADADALTALLSSKYGFETELRTANGNIVPLVLKDPTKRQIEIALHHVGKTAGEKDTVLIFFAGHGIFEPVTSIAYWVPSDAEAGFEPSYLSAADISAAIQRIQSGNVILISDSCYSGALLRGGPADEESFDEAERTQVMLKLQSRRSRIVITSGNNEPVQDLGGQGHSVFARALITGLEQMDHEAFSARELFDDFIIRQVSANADQEPQYRPLEKVGHEGGDFVFVKATKG